MGDREAIATVAVRDMKAASRFYEETLGLTRVASQGSGAYTYRAGGAKLLVYQSQYAGSNSATAVTWVVGDAVDELVRTLKSKGVTFERYELPGVRLEGDVHVSEYNRIAWFKDPDGNIHSLVSG
ncbi:MAG TPA: VOC family protein [Gemmatimonadaceae bacterium]|nr:VOC family protein [Gemmatimonadaceae bacterium]